MRKYVCGTLLACVVLYPALAADEGKKPAGKYAVEVNKNVAYFKGKGAHPTRHKLDIYLPTGKKNFPVLVFIHGGGWQKGDKRSFDPAGRMFAHHGIGAVSVGYRLSPDVKHPAHIQDVTKAFAWTVRNIGKYGGRADAIFVSGHSAGGHLAALLGTDESYLKAEGLSLKNIRGVIPISGVFQIGGRGKMVVQAFGDDREELMKASPLTHVAAGDPPFLVLAADKDLGNLRQQAGDFAEALKEQKCDARSVIIKDRDHGTIMRKIASEDDPATKLIFEFIAKHSGAKQTTKD